MDHEDGPEDDGPTFPCLPPDDRLWRHPSELRSSPVPGRPLAAPTVVVGRHLWPVALVAGVIGALVASGLFVAAGGSHHTTVVEQVASPRTVLTTSDQGATAAGWPAVADAVSAAVAAVSVNGPAGTTEGSAVICGLGHDATYLLTSADLLSGGGGVAVTFDGGRPVTGRVVGTDPLTGLALLSVPGDQGTMPVYGSIAGVALAEAVLAVGSRVAGGVGVAPGSVSGVDQAVDAGGTPLYGMLAVSGLSVDSTSDGGVVVDQDGQVVGIEADMTTLSNQDGLAYAVPADVAERVAAQLLAGHKPTHPWIGLTGTSDLSSTSAAALGLHGGAQIGAVVAGSPAAQAGMDDDDVVTGFDGRTIASAGGLTVALAGMRPGQRAAITWLDGQVRHAATVVVGSQPATAGS